MVILMFYNPAHDATAAFLCVLLCVGGVRLSSMSPTAEYLLFSQIRITNRKYFLPQARRSPGPSPRRCPGPPVCAPADAVVAANVRPSLLHAIVSSRSPFQGFSRLLIFTPTSSTKIHPRLSSSSSLSSQAAVAASQPLSAAPPASASSPTHQPDPPNQGVRPNPDPLPQNQPADRVQMNAQGGAALNDDELNRDWLDWLYTVSRAGVLLSIVYFYSSFSRFVMVVGAMLLVYL